MGVAVEWVQLQPGQSSGTGPCSMPAPLLHTGMIPASPWEQPFPGYPVLPAPDCSCLTAPGAGNERCHTGCSPLTWEMQLFGIFYPQSCFPSLLQSDAETSPSSLESHLLHVRRGNHLSLCFTASLPGPGRRQQIRDPTGDSSAQHRTFHPRSSLETVLKFHENGIQ